MRTVLRWLRKLLIVGNHVSKTVPVRSGRPKTSITETNIEAVKAVVEEYARFTLKEIASRTSISEGSVFAIHERPIREVRAK